MVVTKTKFPCGNCNKTTSGCASLQCSICEMWHHRECVAGMTKEAYQQLVSMKETMGYSFFLCGKCEKVHKKVWQAVTKLGHRVDTVEKRLDEIEAKLKKQEEEQKEYKKKVATVESKTAATATDVKETVITELQQQENRKTNIVVYNLKESEAEEGLDRKNHDLSEIGALLQQIELPTTVKEVTQASSSPRVLQVSHLSKEHPLQCQEIIKVTISPCVRLS